LQEEIEVFGAPGFQLREVELLKSLESAQYRQSGGGWSGGSDFKSTILDAERFDCYRLIEP
jgi:hypothetical protein